MKRMIRKSVFISLICMAVQTWILAQSQDTVRLAFEDKFLESGQLTTIVVSFKSEGSFNGFYLKYKENGCSILGAEQKNFFNLNLDFDFLNKTIERYNSDLQEDFFFDGNELFFMKVRSDKAQKFSNCFDLAEAYFYTGTPPVPLPVSFTFDLEIPLGKIILSPNPSGHDIEISYNGPLNQSPTILKLTNEIGQVVLEETFISAYDIKFIIPRHNAGVYILQIIQDDQILGWKKLIFH